MKSRRESEVKSQNRCTMIKVDAIPPSVNSYVRHGNGAHYIDAGAREFKYIVHLSCAGKQPVYGLEFEVELVITLGKGQKGDVDNFPKLVLDAVSRAGMLRDGKTGEPKTDSHVTRLEIVKERGERPQTLITLIGVP